MMDTHEILLAVFYDQHECQDCEYRNKEWNPDARAYDYGCDIIDSEFSRRPIPATDCPGVEEEMAKHEEDA